MINSSIRLSFCFFIYLFHPLFNYSLKYLRHKQRTICFTLDRSFICLDIPIEYNDQNGKAIIKQLSVNVPKELTSSLETSREPVVVKIATEGGIAEISKENSGPILEHIEVHLPSKIMKEPVEGAGLTPLTSSIESSAQVPEGIASVAINLDQSYYFFKHKKGK